MQPKENSVTTKAEPKNEQNFADALNANLIDINSTAANEKHNAEKLVEGVYYKKNVFQFDSLTPKSNMNSNATGDMGKYSYFISLKFNRLCIHSSKYLFSYFLKKLFNSAGILNLAFFILKYVFLVLR